MPSTSHASAFNRLSTRIYGINLYAQNIIWAYMTGVWPEIELTITAAETKHFGEFARTA